MAASSSSSSVTLPYPRGAFFILVGYLLERFVYYERSTKEVLLRLLLDDKCRCLHGPIYDGTTKDSVQCFGDDCYFLPYIILVGLMALSTLIFALGRSRYTEAPPDPTLLNAIKCIFHATRKSWESNKKPVTHWIDRAHDKFDTQLLVM
ncbi:hypothetical protein Pcinc_036370 [Petrolisthes cinctipes]|uniref:Uncharacterized protein n=1 Tax=Petrolisthes cinctipes TaxID=88211 RepID=A0AAE1EM24_PETCI|nr:hypothetical protein Pcinc_036370 [Petrolisthes cinctipes]